MYIKYILNRPLVLIFGRSPAPIYLGQMHSHNVIIDTIYGVGLVGYILFIFMMYILLGEKKLFNIKRYIHLLIAFIPYMISVCLNTNFSFIYGLLFVLIIKNIAEDRYKNNKNTVIMKEMIRENIEIKNIKIKGR